MTQSGLWQTLLGKNRNKAPSKWRGQGEEIEEGATPHCVSVRPLHFREVNTRNDALADRTPKAFRAFLTLGFTKEN
jgi:hypothetical protein